MGSVCDAIASVMGCVIRQCKLFGIHYLFWPQVGSVVKKCVL